MTGYKNSPKCKTSYKVFKTYFWNTDDITHNTYAQKKKCKEMKHYLIPEPMAEHGYITSVAQWRNRRGIQMP